MTKTLTHAYSPRGGCRTAFTARDSEILLSGPAGTGKSLALLERLLVMALKYPGMRGLIVRKTLASLGSTALVTWREHVAVEAIASGLMKYYGGSSEEPPQYKFTNGSTILVGGLDRPSRIMSMEIDIAYVQEAIELNETDWEAITTRLRNGKIPYQMLLADTNPDTPTHWLKVRCNQGKTRMIESRHEDNPTLLNADGTATERGREYISKLDNLSGVRKQRLRHGLWVAAEGMIYEEYDPAVHLIDRFRVPKDWTRYWSIDFGFVNPFVWQDWAIDPDGVAYLTAEIYQTKRTVDQHAKAILSHVQDQRKQVGRHGEWLEAKPRAILCDHDAEGRAVLERELGLSCTPAHKAVTEGIQAVQMAMRERADGKRGIYLMRDSRIHPADIELLDAKKPTCTAEEIPGYIWDEGAGKTPKETPVKEDDHGCLIGSTMVATPDGEQRIDRIRSGDLVVTRDGTCQVTAAGMTSLAAETLAVELSNGRTLIGTGNHPVWANGQWTRLDALRYADTLEPCGLKPFDLTTSSIAGTQTHPCSLPGSTSHPTSLTSERVRGYFTLTSGNTSTDRTSQTATRSTTQTSTSSTTDLTTWCVSRSLSTSGYTRIRPVSGAGRLKQWLIWTVFDRWLHLGIPALKDSPGTQHTLLSRDSVTESRSNEHVTSAGSSTSTRQPAPSRLDSVPTTASPPPAGQAVSTTLKGTASYAEISSQPTGTPSTATAPVRVLSVRASVRQPVYNLTICGSPEYFANGVLVHNCDAGRYFVIELTRGRPRVRVMSSR